MRHHALASFGSGTPLLASTRFVVALFVLLVGAASCSRQDPQPASATGTKSAAGGATTRTGASGGRTLTRAQLEDAKTLVQTLQPWDATYAKVVAKLGEPHGNEPNGVFWSAVEGEMCSKLIMNKSGSEVGTVQLTGVNKVMKKLWEKCVTGT